MKHIIENKEVNIDWDQKEILDNHGSGCQDWMIEGEDEDGVKYFAQGNYQSGELMEVTDIEEA